MAITNLQEARNFVNGGFGNLMPTLKSDLEQLEWYYGRAAQGQMSAAGRARQQQYFINKINSAAQNSKQYAIDQVNNLVKNIVIQTAYNNPRSLAQANDYKQQLDPTIKYLIQNEGLPITSVSKILQDAEYQANVFAGQEFERQYKRSSLDNFFDFAEILMGAVAIPGMGKVLASSLGVSGAVGNAIANTTMAIANGADPQKALETVLAGMTSYEAGEYIVGLSKINDPILKNTLGNAITQGTNAALLGNDVKTAVLAGAAGGAVAGATLKATDDAAIAAAAGEYSKNVAAGMSSQDAMTNALVDFILAERDEAEKKVKQKVEGETQPVATKPGSQLGEPSAGIGDIDISAPTNISSLKEFQPLSGETGNAVVKVTDRDGIVSYKRNITKVDANGKETGYTIVYDPDTKKFTYEWANPVLDSAGNLVSYEAVADSARPGQEGAGVKTPTSDSITLSTQPKVPIAKPEEPTAGGKDISKDIIDLTGIGKETGAVTEGAGVTDTGIEAGVDTSTGEGATDTATDISVDTGTESGVVESGATQGGTVEEAGKEETVSQGEAEGEAEGEIAGEDQLTQDDLILLGLVGGKDDGNAPTPAAKPTPTASTQALSQALRVGDPGEPLFGGKLGKRKSVWNEESLRIKDELGG
jgi:hypothetical protein